MPLDLYGMPIAYGNRAIALTAKAVGVELNIKLLNPRNNEQMTPEFIKINPQHTVPTLVDDGFSVWESRVICSYLVNKYAKDDSLYPKDPKKRAVVDQRLYFDMGTLNQRFVEYYYPLIRGTATEFDPASLEKLLGAVKFLETFLEGHDYVAGDQLTIADFVIVATVSSFDCIDLDLSLFKNVTRWLAKVKATAPGYEEANGKPVAEYVQFFKSLMPKK